MLTRRELITAAGAGVLAASAGATPAGNGAGQAGDAPTRPVMSSTVFEWGTLAAQPTDVGSVRRVCQAPTATLDELECHVTTLNAGTRSHAPHRHPDEELIVIKEGTVEVFMDGVTKQAGPGSVIFYASNQLHGLRNIGTTPATYHVFRWNSPGMLEKNRAAAKG